MVITNVIITGASGFIGQHLIKTLSNNHKVIAVNRAELKKELINENVSFIKCDLFECKSSNFKDADVIIHSAGTAENKGCFEKNFILTKTILDSILQLEHYPTFIFLSSYAVYGNRILPAKETDTMNPEDEYALSKVLCETMINFYSKKFNLKAHILRVGGVYGDGGKGIVNKILDSINKKKPLSITGLEQYRNFVYVGDVCNIISKLVEVPIEETEIYNIGADENITINQLLVFFKEFPIFKIEKSNSKKISYMIDNGKIKNRLKYNFLRIEEHIENEKNLLKFRENMYGKV